MANPGPPMAARCHSLPVPGMNHSTDDLPKRCAKRLDRSSAWLPPALLYVPAGHLSSRVEFLLKKMQFRQTLVPVLNSQRPLSFPLCPPGRVILVLAKTKMLSASLSWLGLSPVHTGDSLPYCGHPNKVRLSAFCECPVLCSFDTGFFNTEMRSEKALESGYRLHTKETDFILWPVRE